MGLENNMTFASGLLYIDDSCMPAAVDSMEVSDIWADDSSPLSITTSRSDTFEGTFEFDPALLRDVMNLDPVSTFTVEYDTTLSEQVRKHKKKRINKKWAKRYGYRQVPYHVTLNDAQVIDDGENGLEIIGNNVKLQRKRI